MSLQRGPTALEGQDVFVRLRIDDSHLALLGIKRLNYRAPEIFFGAQHPQSFARTFFDLRGIGPEETGCARHVPAHHRIVLAQVMALHAIAPCASRGRGAEYGYVVFLGIALGPGAVFDDTQYVLQAHDRFRLQVALLAEPRAEKRRSQMLLRRCHFPQRQAFSLDRNKVPVLALIVFEREGSLGALLGC